MFTGIVEETGVVASFKEAADAWKLILKAQEVLPDLAIGDSLACNGCCLTVVELGDGTVSFDLLEESVRLTSFRAIAEKQEQTGSAEGVLVNLERSLAAGGRLGGHFVSGHVDTPGEVQVLETRGKNVYLKVRVPDEFLKYLVYKGSVAIDGISLTVAEVHDDGFAVWLIPHTMYVTNLQQRKPGDPVNLEFDILAKYVERILAGSPDGAGPYSVLKPE